MADSTAQIPVWGDELKDFINIGTSDSPNWLELTNLLSWEFDSDSDAYEPEYIDTKNRPSYTKSKSATIEYEKDLYTNNELDAFLVKNRNNLNLAVEVIRANTWLTGTSGNPVADKAAFSLTPNALDKNSAGEPVKLTGTLSMTDQAWTEGTFDIATKTFTSDADAADVPATEDTEDTTEDSGGASGGTSEQDTDQAAG